MTGRARARARGRARGGVTEKDDRRPGGPPESKQEVRSFVYVITTLHTCLQVSISPRVLSYHFTLCHPSQSGPSSRYLPSHIHRCYFLSSLLITRPYHEWRF